MPWYNHHLAQRPLSSSVARLPSLSLPQLPLQLQAGSISAGAVSSSASSASRPAVDDGLSAHPPAATKARTLNDRPADLALAGPVAASQSSEDPSFVIAPSAGLPYTYSHESYPQNGMDHAQSYLDVHQPHITAGQSHAPSTVTSGAVTHYPQYGHPPLLQPGPAAYPSTQGPFGHYQYANGVTSPQNSGHSSAGAAVAAAASQVPAQLLPLPGMSAELNRGRT